MPQPKLSKRSAVSRSTLGHALAREQFEADVQLVIERTRALVALSPGIDISQLQRSIRILKDGLEDAVYRTYELAGTPYGQGWPAAERWLRERAVSQDG